MQRKPLLSILGFLYISTAAAVLGWAATGYLGSAEVAMAEVKGASTTQLASAAPTPELAPYPSIISKSPSPNIYAKEYALYNPQSGKVIVTSKNLDMAPIASTTKLMTAHVVSKYGNLNDITTVSQTAGTMTGSVAGLRVGEKISIKNLLYCLLLPSGNDAAHALAEYTGGILLGNPSASAEDRTARFVQEMNAEAIRLNMSSTHYLDPAGLNDDGHSNAVDLTKIGSIDIADPNVQSVLNTPDITINDQSGFLQHVLHDSDRLVADYHYEGSLGGKTGFTPAAGHCLMSSAERDGHILVAVVLNTDSTVKSASADEAMKLLDWGFTNVSWQ